MSVPYAQPDSIDAAPPSGVTILVCVTCRHGESEGPRPGQLLFEALQSRLASIDVRTIALAPVECLSVCKRPCTVALAAPGKWTYVVGDLDREANIEDIVEAATRFAATPDGIVPWRERPKPFRKGVISRTPPLPSLLPLAGESGPQGRMRVWGASGAVCAFPSPSPHPPPLPQAGEGVEFAAGDA